MPRSRRHQIAHQFAEGLVAQMLQRSGSEFFHVTPSRSAGHADLLVSHGDGLCGIEVRYEEHAEGIERIWTEWKDVVRTSGIKQRSALARTMKAIRGETKTNQSHPDVHLVIVTGTGDRIYAEQIIAPLLTPDDRSHISILGE
ncbi:hypothetical protein [Herbaspirillum sp. CAH-3]|jgi:hypothetical protein|uniref:hypothetical protein n=1 Tax=Herbaspirillum sp. CAH-3 TaxID=2605746 RepID=UPI0012AD0A22|nr:hypothetical protein [Herbaspirillum sp. CAH-3]MRT32070.1 hypothetical protein [Herbaspirillum sp. CAH-3]